MISGNPSLKLRERKQLIWPVAGIVLGVLVAMNPFYKPHVTLAVGVAAWFVDLALVLMLSAHPVKKSGSQAGLHWNVMVTWLTW